LIVHLTGLQSNWSVQAGIVISYNEPFS